MISSRLLTSGPGRNPPLSPSIQRHIVDTARRLEQAGIPDSRHEAYILLQHAAGWSLTELMCQLDRPAPAQLVAALAAHVDRRLAREPLQHITRAAAFYGRMFTIDSRALIPRPETEILVERVIALLPNGQSRVLDVGTGSGILAATLVLELDHVVVDAVDISADAIQVARANIAAHGVGGRCNLLRADLGAPLRQIYDAVVANLPYVPTADCADLQQEVRQWEPVVALDGGPDGLACMRRLVGMAPSLLRPGGLLALESGAGQAGELEALLESSGQWTGVTVVPDLAGIPRVLTARTSCD